MKDIPCARPHAEPPRTAAGKRANKIGCREGNILSRSIEDRPQNEAALRGITPRFTIHRDDIPLLRKSLPENLHYLIEAAISTGIAVMTE